MANEGEFDLLINWAAMKLITDNFLKTMDSSKGFGFNYFSIPNNKFEFCSLLCLKRKQFC